MSHFEGTNAIQAWLRRLVLLGAAVLTLTGGCSCTPDDGTQPTVAAPGDKPDPLKKKPFEKPDLNILPQFSPEPPKTVERTPGDPTPKPDPNKSDPNAERGIDMDYIKPRHWVAVRERRQANDQDVPGGELVGELLSGSSQPIPLENVPYRLSVERDVALAKGRPKFPEYRFYAAPGRSPLWSSDLRDRDGTDYQPYSYGLSRLATQSYLFVILTEDPTRFKRWPDFDTMRTPARAGTRPISAWSCRSWKRPDCLCRAR
ncbi:MAG: hypothetical protein QM811_17000 [Pirellulales bacterium]